MSEFIVDKITNREGTSGTQIAGITTFSGTSGMQLPVGPTEFRRQDGGGRGRAIFAGGYEAPSNAKEIQTVEIATTGNGVDFGDMSVTRREAAAAGNTTRGVIAGGTGPITDSVEFIVMSSQGGGNDFGNLSSTRRSFSGSGNDTRGIFFGGNNPSRTSIVEFINFAHTGSVNEFGRLGVFSGYTSAGEGGFPSDDNGSCSSPTRAIVFGSGDANTINSQKIQFVTISTLGDTQLFGDLTNGVRYTAGCSSPTRGLRGGGKTSSEVDTIDFVTIASTGNATDFGNLTDQRSHLGSASSHTRGLFTGGYDQPSVFNIIDFLTIASTGNAVDFGDLTFTGLDNGKSRNTAGCSDANGGLL